MSSICPDCLAEIAAEQESCTSCGFVRPASGWTPDPLSGLILGGRYRLEGRLGAGGMASVFRASRIGALGGVVAVKVLAPRFARTVVARRFEREAQVVARLTNPHVVRVYDFDNFSFTPAGGGSPVPLYYIAMELIEGQTLGQLLKAQGKVNFLWGIDVLRQLARGLEEAHGLGIVHRDLKPSNAILVQHRGATHVKILDFGIAALSLRDEKPGAPAQEKLTQTGFVSGTPDYMAPEQAVGDPSVGPAADMFSLGVMAFEMFTGRKPFEGATMESLLARVTKGAPSLRAVVTDASFPPELFRIVDKLLARDPKERYQNAGELLDDLHRFPTLQTTPDFVPPAELIERYATGASQPAFVVADTMPAGGARGAAAVVRTAAQDLAMGQATHTGVHTVAGRPSAKAGEMTRPKNGKKSTWWVWLLALLVLGGAGTAIALVLTNKGPSKPPPPETATVAAADGATGQAPDAGAADGVAAVDAKALAPFRDGARPALEEGFIEVRLERGKELVSIGEPSTKTPLYMPLPLRVAFDREGKPMNIAAGAMTVKLERDGREAGKAEGTGRPDGRLEIDLPPRPLADRFAIELALTLGGDEKQTVKLAYDAGAGTFEVTP